MKTIYDNASKISRADDRFILEENEDGLLFETSNAVTLALVCGSMFHRIPEREALIEQFGSEEIADRYLHAANDFDK